ncbi:MAG: hypothetical protein WC471_02525 [Candidatus Woesearchaeota archaeon]
MEQCLSKISMLTDNMSEVINAILREKLDKDIVLDDFKKNKQSHYQNLMNSSLSELAKLNTELDQSLQDFHSLNKIKGLLDALLNNKKKYNHCELLEIVKELKTALPTTEMQKETYDLRNLPGEIRTEVIADLEEAKRCQENGCYRSATILCGRILETCLHRKYYEITNKDILETCPDMGLGKLIAKLSELQVKFDPGLTEQIHLINKVRIGSVHVKKETFNPSKSQTQAMLLYSVDAIHKLF